MGSGLPSSLPDPLAREAGNGVDVSLDPRYETGEGATLSPPGIPGSAEVCEFPVSGNRSSFDRSDSPLSFPPGAAPFRVPTHLTSSPSWQGSRSGHPSGEPKELRARLERIEDDLKRLIDSRFHPDLRAWTEAVESGTNEEELRFQIGVLERFKDYVEYCRTMATVILSYQPLEAAENGRLQIVYGERELWKNFSFLSSSGDFRDNPLALAYRALSPERLDKIDQALAVVNSPDLLFLLKPQAVATATNGSLIHEGPRGYAQRILSWLDHNEPKVRSAGFEQLLFVDAAVAEARAEVTAAQAERRVPPAVLDNAVKRQRRIAESFQRIESAGRRLAVLTGLAGKRELSVAEEAFLAGCWRVMAEDAGYYVKTFGFLHEALLGESSFETGGTIWDHDPFRREIREKWRKFTKTVAGEGYTHDLTDPESRDAALETLIQFQTMVLETERARVAWRLGEELKEVAPLNENAPIFREASQSVVRLNNPIFRLDAAGIVQVANIAEAQIKQLALRQNVALRRVHLEQGREKIVSSGHFSSGLIDRYLGRLDFTLKLFDEGKIDDAVRVFNDLVRSDATPLLELETGLSEAVLFTRSVAIVAAAGLATLPVGAGMSLLGAGARLTTLASAASFVVAEKGIRSRWTGEPMSVEGDPGATALVWMKEITAMYGLFRVLGATARILNKTFADAVARRALDRMVAEGVIRAGVRELNPSQAVLFKTYCELSFLDHLARAGVLFGGEVGAMTGWEAVSEPVAQWDLRVLPHVVGAEAMQHRLAFLLGLKLAHVFKRSFEELVHKEVRDFVRARIGKKLQAYELEGRKAVGEFLAADKAHDFEARREGFRRMRRAFDAIRALTRDREIPTSFFNNDLLAVFEEVALQLGLLDQAYPHPQMVGGAPRPGEPGGPEQGTNHSGATTEPDGTTNDLRLLRGVMDRFDAIVARHEAHAVAPTFRTGGEPEITYFQSKEIGQLVEEMLGVLYRILDKLPEGKERITLDLAREGLVAHLVRLAPLHLTAAQVVELARHYREAASAALQATNLAGDEKHQKLQGLSREVSETRKYLDTIPGSGTAPHVGIPAEYLSATQPLPTSDDILGFLNEVTAEAHRIYDDPKRCWEVADGSGRWEQIRDWILGRLNYGSYKSGRLRFDLSFLAGENKAGVDQHFRELIGIKGLDLEILGDGWVHFAHGIRDKGRDARFYLAVKAEHAGDLLNHLSTVVKRDADEKNYTFTGKLLNFPEEYERRGDPCLLHTTPEGAHPLLTQLISVAQSHPEWFHDRIPLLTHPVFGPGGRRVPGLAYARGGDFPSFGQRVQGMLTQFELKVYSAAVTNPSLTEGEIKGLWETALKEASLDKPDVHRGIEDFLVPDGEKSAPSGATTAEPGGVVVPSEVADKARGEGAIPVSDRRVRIEGLWEDLRRHVESDDDSPTIDLTEVQHRLAKAISDRPEDYTVDRCERNAAEIVGRYLSPEERKGAQVVIAASKTATDANYFLYPNGGVTLGDGTSWPYHVFVVLGGRVFDFYYPGRPGAPLGTFVREMFLHENDLKVVAVPAEEYLAEGGRPGGPARLAEHFWLRDPSRRMTFGEYFVFNGMGGALEPFGDIPLRGEIHAAWGAFREVRYAGGTVTVDYEAFPGFHPERFAEMVARRVARIIREGGATLDEASLTIRSREEISPDGLRRAVSDALRSLGLRGAITISNSVGSDTDAPLTQRPLFLIPAEIDHRPSPPAETEPSSGQRGLERNAVTDAPTRKETDPSATQPFTAPDKHDLLFRQVTDPDFVSSHLRAAIDRVRQNHPEVLGEQEAFQDKLRKTLEKLNYDLYAMGNYGNSKESHNAEADRRLQEEFQQVDGVGLFEGIYWREFDAGMWSRLEHEKFWPDGRFYLAVAHGHEADVYRYMRGEMERNAHEERYRFVGKLSMHASDYGRRADVMVLYWKKEHSRAILLKLIEMARKNPGWLIDKTPFQTAAIADRSGKTVPGLAYGSDRGTGLFTSFGSRVARVLTDLQLAIHERSAEGRPPSRAEIVGMYDVICKKAGVDPNLKYTFAFGRDERSASSEIADFLFGDPRNPPRP